MNILIIGAGAIGCLMGGKLARTNHQVTLVGRPHFAEAVRAHGLSLADETGDHSLSMLYPVGNIAEAFAYIDAPFDLAILTVKSYDTGPAIAELSTAVEQSGEEAPTILSLQNGVGNEQTIAATFGNARTIAGVITTPVTVLGPGAIRVDKPNYDIGISPWDAAVPATIVTATQQALTEGGFSPIPYLDPQGLKWTKLLMNIVGNASSAILDMPPDRVFADAALVDLEIEAWREAMRVMKAADIPPVNLGSYPFTLLTPLVRTIPKPLLRGTLRKRIGAARGGKMPSLHIDLHSGRNKSEIKWLNGAVVEKGEEVAVPTPINRMLTETLLVLIDNPMQRATWQENRALFLATAQMYHTGKV